VRVKVELVVEVDAAKWREAAGLGEHEDARADLRSYLIHSTQEVRFAMLTEDAEGTVEVKQ